MHDSMKPLQDTPCQRPASPQQLQNVQVPSVRAAAKYVAGRLYININFFPLYIVKADVIIAIDVTVVINRLVASSALTAELTVDACETCDCIREIPHKCRSCFATGFCELCIP